MLDAMRTIGPLRTARLPDAPIDPPDDYWEDLDDEPEQDDDYYDDDE